MKLSHFSPLLLIAACSINSTESPSGLDTNRLLDGDNGDSQECQACAAEVEACLVNGGDQCADLYFECERICLDPRDEPPGDCRVICEEQLGQCEENQQPGDPTDPNQPGDPTDPNNPDDPDGNGFEDCGAHFDECLRGCEGDVPPEPCVECEGQLDECLNGAGNNFGDRDECYWRFEECANACNEPPPGGDCDHCELGLEECINEGGSEQECIVKVEECLQQCRGGDQPDDPTCNSCDVDVERCLIDAGDDEAAREQCWANHGNCCDASCP